MDDDMASGKNSSPSEHEVGECHAEAATLVGRYVEVEYPSRGALKGLVTGYYRETTFFRIDFAPQTSLRCDSGVVVERRLFHSEEDECFCTISIADPIQDSCAASKYFDASLTNFSPRTGRVGYMLGKIVKSDWGNDGVFLGILVNYQRGQKFQVKYMDGDDEWGTFVEMFTAFNLEEGGQRKISWFDLRADELQAAGKDTSQRRTPSQEIPSKLQIAADDQEIKKTAATMLNDICKHALDGQETGGAPREEGQATGVFTSAFRQKCKIDPVEQLEPQRRLKQRESMGSKAIKRTGPKRALEMTDEDDGHKKSQKIDPECRPKRQRAQANGTAEHQPATKKSKNRAQREGKSAALMHAPLILLSEQTTEVASPPKKETAEPEGPRTDSIEERTASIDLTVSSEPQTCSIQTTQVPPAPPKVVINDQTQAKSCASPRSTLVSERTKPLQHSSPAHQNSGVAPPPTSAQEPAPSAVIPHKPPTSEKLRTNGSMNSTTVTSPAITSPSVRRPARYSSIEIGLEMQNFEKHLENLTISRERIAKATKVAVSLAHCGGAKRAIDAVVIQMKEPVGAERKITLFYLLDSILQFAHKDRARAPLGKSTGETIVFLELVERHMKEIVETLADEYDSYTKLEKVLELWKDGHVFSAESMDHALAWLHEKSERHERFLEDDRLRNEKRIPYYIRSPDGPQCHRVILSRVFATVGGIPECLNVPAALSEKKLELYDKSAWDEIDKAIEEEVNTSYHRGRRARTPQEDNLSDEQPEEGEIPAQPPLPSDSPPEDVDDPNFVAPLPSDDEDPNFVPPLPTSPPPAQAPPSFRNDHSRRCHRGRDFSGGLPNDRSLVYRGRTDRFDGDHQRGRLLDSGRPPSRRSPQRREFEKNWYRGRYRQEEFCQEMYPRQPPYPLHPRPMQHLPHPFGNASYPYPPHAWSHGRPPHHPESYAMWNPHRRHW